MRVVVVMPALNEEQAIGNVLNAIPREQVQRVVVVDNGSTDRTAAIARDCGADVVHEPRQGYGQACLTGIAHARDADILLFLDADASDRPSDATALLSPIRSGRADMVLGSRSRGPREAGALPPHARFGNYLASFLMLLFWGARYSDLGPFRAIRVDAYEQLGMADRNFGWTVEMQIKAARRGLRIREVPVAYRRRIGESKISGTLAGSFRAGWKILYTIARYAV